MRLPSPFLLLSLCHSLLSHHTFTSSFSHSPFLHFSCPFASNHGRGSAAVRLPRALYAPACHSGSLSIHSRVTVCTALLCAQSPSTLRNGRDTRFYLRRSNFAPRAAHNKRRVGARCAGRPASTAHAAVALYILLYSCLDSWTASLPSPPSCLRTSALAAPANNCLPRSWTSHV